MKEKILHTKPGVLIGLSTYKGFKGKHLSFYDKNTLIMEVELDYASPPQNTPEGEVPGIEENLFFKHNLKMKYPAEAEEYIEVLVAD